MLTQISENIWGAESEVVMGKIIHFPVRMTVLRLEDGGLILYSPIRLDEDLVKEVKALGTVKWIVAPNGFHHLFVRKAHKHFPQAKLVGVSAVAAKRSDIDFDMILDEGIPEAWNDEIDVEVVGGMPMVSEAVFFHRGDHALVVADFLFNITKANGLFSTVVFKMAGTLGKFGQSRIFLSAIKDKEAIRQSAKRILDWDIKRLVVSHGAIAENIGAEDLRKKLNRIL